uniref:Estrogen sulfotransferase n=1 Tax=Aceria tosichella TaxID=561515 RepID=A0A6G1SMV5_9ACAR
MQQQPAKVYLDEVDHLIKVDSNEAVPVGQFGSSVLYKWDEFNFHPRAYEILTKIQQLKFREDDIILTMFPKSGSTWLSECIYLIVNQYQYESASKESIEYRFPQIDSPSHDVFDLILEQYNNPNQRRMIKSSVPPNLLINRRQQQPNGQPMVKPKVISIMRNPRDVLVSFYHHCKTVKHYDIGFSFDEFYETFVTGRVPCGPIWLMYNEMYKYHCQNPKTSLIVYYEDMKQDLRKQIKRICEFLGKPEPANEDAWFQLSDHLSVDRMRQNRTINRHDWDQLGLRNENGFEFIRKGQVNDWKNFFNEQQSLRFDREITDKLLPELKARYGHQQY